MLKWMNDFYEYTNNKYGNSMSIPTNQYLSSNVYPEHNGKPYNADSWEMEDIYVLQYTSYPSTARGISLAVNDGTLDV